MTDDLNSASLGHESSILVESERRGIPLGSLANLLTLSRFAAAALWLILFSIGIRGAEVLAPIAIGAAATDVIDGIIARRLGTASARGHWLDSFADIAFVLTALSCEASAGSIPVYLPILIAIAFAQYALDSWLIGRGERAPIKSRIGHWGGIVNYALTIVLASVPLPLWPASLAKRAAPGIAIFYIAGIAERAIMYRGG